jgi:hypothetical protein
MTLSDNRFFGVKLLDDSRIIATDRNTVGRSYGIIKVLTQHLPGGNENKRAMYV